MARKIIIAAPVSSINAVTAKQISAFKKKITPRTVFVLAQGTPPSRRDEEVFEVCRAIIIAADPWMPKVRPLVYERYLEILTGYTRDELSFALSSAVAPATASVSA